MSENSPEEYQPEHRGNPPSAHGLMSNKLYDRLKFIAMVVLPALVVLYLSMAPLWGLPKQEEVAGSIAALDVFLGALLGISSSQHKQNVAVAKAFATNAPVEGGKIVFQETGGEPEVNLILSGNPKDWEGQQEVTFKIQPR